MIDSVIEPLFLAIFIPIAGYKIFRFTKKINELASESSSTTGQRDLLERAWVKKLESNQN